MYDNTIRDEKITEKPPKRKFWQNLLINGSGDLKKVLSLSSLMMSFLILLIYFAAYILIMPLLDRIIGSGPVLIVNLIEAVIPALIATGAILLTWPLYRDKRVLPAAYLWLTLLSLILFAVVLINLKGDQEAKRTFIYIFMWNVLPSLIIGNAAVWLKYRKFLYR